MKLTRGALEFMKLVDRDAPLELQRFLRLQRRTWALAWFAGFIAGVLCGFLLWGLAR